MDIYWLKRKTRYADEYNYCSYCSRCNVNHGSKNCPIYVNDNLYTDDDSISNADLLKLCASLCHNVTKNDDIYF